MERILTPTNYELIPLNDLTNVRFIRPSTRAATLLRTGMMLSKLSIFWKGN